jgi:hypothetical protein
MVPTVDVNCRRLLSFGADLRFCLGSCGTGGASRFSFLGARACGLLGPVKALGLSGGDKLEGGGLGGSSSPDRDDPRSDFDLLRLYVSGVIGGGDLTLRRDRRSSISVPVWGADGRGLSTLDCGGGGIGSGWGALLVGLGGGAGSSWAVLEEQMPMKEC